MNDLAQHEVEQEIHLTDYLKVLQRHKTTILLSFLVMTLLVVLHNARLVPIYESTSTLILDRENSNSPLTGQRTDYETYMSESLTFNTHFELIRSRAVMEGVINDLKLDQPGAMWGQDESVETGIIGQVVDQVRTFVRQMKANAKLLFSGGDEDTGAASGEVDEMTALVQTVQGMITIEPVEETRLLRINVRSPYPEAATEVANATAQAYINFNIDNRMQSSQNTMKWLNDHLYGMKKKLEAAESEFLRYKQDAKLISVEESQRVIAQKITEFNDAYLKARNQRLEVDAKLSQLHQAAGSGADVSHLRSLFDNRLIDDLYSQLANAEVERARLLKVFKAKHPKVVQASSQIGNTRAKIRQEITKEMENLKAERAVLLSREGVLQRTMKDFEQEALATNKKELQHTILHRDVELNREMYDTLLARLKEVNITGNIDVSNIRITDRATLPLDPVGPNKMRNLILGMIFGLMVGVGCAFLLEYIDRTIHTEEDVQRYLDLPVLSLIPLAEQGREGGYGYEKQ